jgi:single-stranded-DNA-specific exonuclease
MADGSGAHGGYLGVEVSLSGRLWRERAADGALARRHALNHALPDALARALAARGVSEADAPAFLHPTLKALFPDPSSFLDMDRAAELIVDAVVAGRRAVVFADYDVDGAASAALLVRWFRAMGADLPVVVPDRLTEGYGPSPAAFRRLKAEGADLVITVDCGAAAQEALEAAAAIDLPVVVVDHHLMRDGDPPPAAALVNPNRPGCKSGQGVLPAAGVVFVLLAALNREARRRGLFADRPEPDLRAWLDLAALGSICDVTALTGFNRVLAAQGLKVMSGWRNPGLSALLETAGGKPGPATAFHAGFLLGPRINAGGRVGRSDLGARLLSTENPIEARALAEELDALNAQRKLVEAEALAAAEHHAQARRDDAVIVVGDDGWHPGVVGIVAGRLRERLRKPVMVIGFDPVTGIGRGSGRSQPGVNLGRAVQAAFDAGLVLAGGGHAMAAGLTVRRTELEAVRAFLNDQLGGETAAAAALDALEIDAAIAPSGADRALLEAFERLAPYGAGNPEPVFALPSVRVAHSQPLRGGHVRCELIGEDGARLKAVAWRCEDTELGRRLLSREGVLHVAGRLRADDWMDRRGVQLEIEDAADARLAR